MTRLLPLLAAATALLLGACAHPVGPDYETPPETQTTEAYKVPGGALAKPEFPSEDWWKMFRDDDLNRLVELADAYNPTTAAALARLEQSQAFIRIARSDLLPNLGAGGRVTLSRQPANLRSGGSEVGSLTGTDVGETDSGVLEVETSGTGGTASSTGSGQTRELYDAGLSLGWELDFWGRVRRLVEGAKADRNAAEAEYETILLSVRSQTARTYFAIRALDEEIRVVRETQETRRQALALQQRLKDVGNASDLEVARADAELATTLATEQNLLRNRGRLENALAALTGMRASNFRVAPKGWNTLPPKVAAGIPGELLIRRPDVATAEERLVAANARIGSAQAEFLPRVTLTGNAGLTAINAQDFLDWSSRTWAFSPSVELPVFQGGRLKGNLNRIKAIYDEALADYQQQILVAFQDVEDALVDLETLRRELAYQNRVVAAARRVEELSNKRYTDGVADYFEVVDAQRTTLESELRVAQLRGLQFTSTVTLVQALGGGWTGLEGYKPAMAKAAALGVTPPIVKPAPQEVRINQAQ